MRFFLSFVCVVNICFATQAQKVEINTGKDKNEILLYLDTAYDTTPQITNKEEYKGVIFKNITAQPQNKRINGSFLNEVQVFNLNNDLYILGIGNPKDIQVDVSKSQQTFKITFTKLAPQPSHLELLMNKSLAIPTQDSDISQNIANLPSPENTNFEQNTRTKELLEQNKNNQSIQQISTQDITESKNTSIIENLQLSNQDTDLESWRYAALVGIMMLLIGILLWTRNSLRKNTNTKSFSSYLAPKSQFEPNTFDPTIKVIAQKKIDSKNKILTIETNGYRYLVLAGINSNTLLDRYTIANNTPDEQRPIQNNLIIEDTQFAKLLEQKAQRLQRLKNDQNI